MEYKVNKLNNGKTIQPKKMKMTKLTIRLLKKITIAVNYKYLKKHNSKKIKNLRKKQTEIKSKICKLNMDYM